MQKVIVRRNSEAHEKSLPNDVHPLLRRIFAGRAITSTDEINHELSDLLNFNLLSNIDVAAKRLAQAIMQNETILIVGDFDADGATSTALAVTALKAMGSSSVSFLVPNRFEYGYGLTPEIIDVALKSQPQLIITVDNGITSHAGVEYANQLNIDVVITDHHMPGNDLPPAAAIVNPNLVGDLFPSKNLAGVGVIFYVLCALRAYLKEQNWFEQKELPQPSMAQFLDLVALGTVADVVQLDKNNRIIVQQGLKRIRAGLSRPGIQALLQIAGRNPQKVIAADLGFAVGPRLNAAGRLDDMSLGIHCLLSEDFSQAKTIAQRLDDLNQERKTIEAQMQKEAFDIVSRLDLKKTLPMGLCLYDEKWHQGIVGLVASRIKDKIHRPVIAFAKIDEVTLKGSARSIEGMHIRDVLSNMAAKYPDLLTKFGGHAMAAGLSIPLRTFEQFKQLFAAEIENLFPKEKLQGQIETDGELDAGHFNLQVAELLRHAGPWGQGFPEPQFDGVFQIVSQYLVGERHLKLMLKLPNSAYTYAAIAFNVDTSRWPNYYCKHLHIVYRLDINEYNNTRSLQLLIENLEVVEHV